MRQPESFHFPPAGTIPNSRRPVLLHKGAFEANATASVYEMVFARNGWSNAWRNGAYPFHRLDSTSHGVLGIARGRAVLRLGGEMSRDVPVLAGEVVILPAGTGHRRMSSESAFLAVGADSDGRAWDLLKADDLSEADVVHAEMRIAALPVPARDPVTGEPMGSIWPGGGSAESIRRAADLC